MNNIISIDESKVIGDYLGYSFTSYLTRRPDVNILKAESLRSGMAILSIEYNPGHYQQALQSIKKTIRRSI